MFWIARVYSGQSYFFWDIDLRIRENLTQIDVVYATYQQLYGSLCRSSARYLRREVSTREWVVVVEGAEMR